MKKHIHSVLIAVSSILCLTLLSTTSAFSQTIKFKNNCEKHFKVTFTGTNKAGEEVTRTLKNVTYGYWKTISLYKTKYGYDLYDNKEMKNDGADGTNRWKTMKITDENNSATDVLDITANCEKKLPGTRIWVRVKIKYERDYEVSSITFFDNSK